MGSNYYGDSSPSSTSSSSSRKGKKGNSDKPKQPQRGLGVAQLEKIRLHGQLASNNYLPSVHNPYATSFSQEDMRLQTAYSSSPSSFSYSSPSSPPYGFHGPHGVMMGLQDLDRANIRYGDNSQSGINVPSGWQYPSNVDMGTQHFVDPSMTTPFFEPGVEGSMNTQKKKKRNSSSDQNSESSGSQDIDLELRLSL